jgi:hypothetical protein
MARRSRFSREVRERRSAVGPGHRRGRGRAAAEPGNAAAGTDLQEVNLLSPLLRTESKLVSQVGGGLGGSN